MISYSAVADNIIKSEPLPAGWKYVPLGRVTKIINGTTPDTNNPLYWNGDIVWLTPVDLGKLNVPYISNSERRITKAGLESRKLKLVPPGTVIMSSRAPIGYLGIADVELCTNQGCKSFMPGPDLDSLFLYYILKKSVWQLQQLGSGATFQEISKTHLEAFIIPLPPLPEQKRIAAILKNQMEIAEQARKAAHELFEAVKALPISFINQIFPEPGQPPPDGWRWARLMDVATIHPGQHILETDYNSLKNGIGYLTGPADFGNMEANITKWTEKPKACADPGDILITVKGAGVGKINLAPSKRVAIGRQLMAIRPLLTVINRDFLFHYLKTQLNYVSAQALGATVPGLSRKQIELILLPLPPMDEQNLIVTKLSSQIKLTDTLIKKTNEQFREITFLPTALLRKAFKGEL